jgi:hypothetical protein
MSLNAEGAKLTDIAADVAKRLRAQVVVGPSLQGDTVWVSVPEWALEAALVLLAPRVVVDYQVGREVGPIPLAIYLLGPMDPAPPSDAVVRGASQGVVIEGHTEDVARSSAEDPLTVTGDRRALTIRSKKQPLELVTRAIGDVLGIPVEVKRGGAELIDADITNAAPEEAILRLSPNVSLYVRVEVKLAERTPLKLVVEPPAGR